jgi:iron complex outermembrane receptor protein
MKKSLLFTTLICFLFAIQYSYAQQQDSAKRVFQLGQINIIGNRDSLKTHKISAEMLQKYNRLDVAQALNLLPGVTLTAVGPRNESAVTVRGFDLRQVPVYLDGIPLYVPYDGYVDLARFNTFNLSEINVAKGYSSVLYGPNAEGGAINLVSRKPVNPFEINAIAGYLSGGYRLNTNIGSRINKFYYELSASQLKRDFYPLSKSYEPSKNEDGGRRNNSSNDDVAISGKIGFMPTENQEYAIGYTYQRGKKGNPVYAGNDPLNSLFRNPRYWNWPSWDTQSLFLQSNNRIDSHNVIKTRWYYDQFKNNLQSFDDATYSAMTRPYAFSSFYDDYTLGSSVIFENTSFKNNNFSLAGHFKKDVHKENNVGEPVRRSADENYTIGAEDTYYITPALKVNAGISYMERRSAGAQQFTNNAVTELPENQNSSWNIQGLVQYNLDEINTLSLSIARKTRFATIKDRYSYRFGTAIPNPDLKAEDAVNYDLTYHTLIGKLSVQASGFYSRISNSIQMVYNVGVDQSTGTQLSQVQNVGKAAYKGAELSIGYSVSEQITLDANYTHLVRKNKSNPQIFLTDVPKNKVFASVTYMPIKRLYILASEEFNSKRYSSSYGTVSGEFYLTHVKANLKLVKGVAIEGGVNNLFDRNYTLVEGFPMAGRNYFANLTYQF